MPIWSGPQHRSCCRAQPKGTAAIWNISSWDLRPCATSPLRYATPVHAGCVAFNGRGMLLCGESGAGKSSLSYACARAGWTYVADDVELSCCNESKDRLVTGNCHQVRFRPSAAELFPEVEGREITPRAAGKPSIELPTAPMPGMTCAPTAQVDFWFFSTGTRPALRNLCPIARMWRGITCGKCCTGPLSRLPRSTLPWSDC